MSTIKEREWLGLDARFLAGRLHVATTCSECGAGTEWTASKNPGPAVVIAKLRARGWKITKRRHVCQTCQLKMSKKEEPPMTVTSYPEKPEPSDAAKKAHRLVILALEEYYNEPAGRYRDGKSDASVAEETGASIDYVKRIREEHYAPLREPDEITKIRGDISALTREFQRSVADFDKRLDDARKRLDALVSKNGWEA